MPYKTPLTFAEVNAALSYDRETGIFTWKTSPAKNVKAGAEAGCVKAARLKKGEPIRYRYIRLQGQEVSAPRLAWLLTTGEWPQGKLFFRDENTLNLAFGNLYLGNSLADSYDKKEPQGNARYLKAHREKFPKAWKDTHLRAKFNLTLVEYMDMHARQGGVCDICKQPETQMRGGKVKALAVDHDHSTGAIRALLCTDCNQAIGKMKDNPAILRAAADYLERHSAKQPNPNSLDPKEGLMNNSAKAIYA